MFEAIHLLIFKKMKHGVIILKDKTAASNLKPILKEISKRKKQTLSIMTVEATWSKWRGIVNLSNYALGYLWHFLHICDISPVKFYDIVTFPMWRNTLGMSHISNQQIFSCAHGCLCDISPLDFYDIDDHAHFQCVSLPESGLWFKI